MSLTSVPQRVVDRFWDRVDRPLDLDPRPCWTWKLSLGGHGYGQVGWHDASAGKNRMMLAHRLAYEIAVGPIPDGLQLDHLCRNPPCVNPAHLEPVTRYENIMRGVGATALNAVKTQCKRGHPFDEANTYQPPGTTQRRCKLCMRMLKRRWDLAHPWPNRYA